ncbi:MAG: S24 family peptidase [Candidatus Kapabacteria bacterium]|nr:S24 family peptidase [Candidatus Kapabacteria bacterium]
MFQRNDLLKLSDHTLYTTILKRLCRAEHGFMSERAERLLIEECERRDKLHIFDTAQRDAHTYSAQVDEYNFCISRNIEPPAIARMHRIDYADHEELRAIIREMAGRAVPDMLHNIIRITSEGYFASDCTGNSMNQAGIDAGDVLIVQAGEEIRSGKVHIVRYRGRTIIKRIITQHDGIELRSESSDARHQTMFVDYSDSNDVQVVGYVQYVIKEVM